MIPRLASHSRALNRLAVLLLLPLLALLLAQLPERNARAAFPGTNGRLVYSYCYSDGLECGLVTQNPDGSCAQNILLDSGPPAFPAWSADGSRIVFWGGYNGGGDQLVTMNADGSGVTVLPDTGGDFAPSWSPDGTQLVVSSARGSVVPDLHIIDANGGNRVVLTQTEFEEELYPVWSPDGERIAFQLNGDIFTIRPDGSDQTNLTNHLAADGWPDWSPDGSKILFTSDRGGNSGELYVMNADGGSPAPLADPAFGEAPVWSPDGTMIAVVHSVSGGVISIMNADGSDKREIGAGGFPDWQPILSPVTQLDVEKKVLGARRPAWAFYLSGVGPFLMPSAGGCKTFSNLESATYTLEEEIVAGYEQSVSCTGGESGETEVQFDLLDGEHVVCTFVNGTLPTLEIVKAVDGPAPEADWQFSGSDPLGDFELPAAGGGKVFEDLQPGEYTIAETPVDGYVSSVICADFGTPEEYSITVDLQLGDYKICRFTNSKTATLTIEKVVVGDAPGDDWQFVSGDLGNFSLPAAGGAHQFENVRPGFYFINETPVAGYRSAVECTDGATGEGGVLVSVAGLPVICTFTNSFIEYGFLPLIMR